MAIKNGQTLGGIGYGPKAYNSLGIPYSSGLFNVKTGGAYDFKVAGSSVFGVNSGGAVVSINGQTFVVQSNNGLSLYSAQTSAGASVANIWRDSSINLNYNTSSGASHIHLINGTAVSTLAAGLLTLATTNGIYFNSSTGTVTGTSRQIAGTSKGMTYNTPSATSHIFSVNGVSQAAIDATGLTFANNHTAQASSVYGIYRTANVINIQMPSGGSALRMYILGTRYMWIGEASAGGGTQVAIGSSAGLKFSSSNNMIAIGSNTLYNGATNPGSEQMAIGSGALAVAATGSSSNIAIGVNCALVSTTLSGNVIIGNSAIQAGVATGTNNVFVGHSSAYNITSASSCVGIGYGSFGSGVTTGTGSTAIGYNSMYSVTSGGYNCAWGFESSYKITTGSYNISAGYQSLARGSAALTGGHNICFGYQTMFAATSANNNVCIGNSGMVNATTLINCIAIGTSAISAVCTATGVMAIGYQAMYNSTGSDYGIAIGWKAGFTVSTAQNAIAIGYQALGGTGAKTGADNIAIGRNSLSLITSGPQNIGIGFQSFAAITTTSGNVGIGYQAAFQNTGTGSVFVGYQSGYGTTSGNYNIGIGQQAFNAATATGGYNIGIGYAANNKVTTGTENIGIGNQSLGYSSAALTGNYNFAVGGGAASRITSGSGNIIMGQYASGNGTTGITSGSNNILIGYGAEVGSATSDNQIYIGGAYLRDSSGVITLRHGTTAATLIYTTSSSALTLATGIALTMTDMAVNFGSTGTVTAANRQVLGVSGGLNYNVPSATTHVFSVNTSAALTVSSTVVTLGTSIKLVIPTSSTPASAGATGTTGTIVWDADYVYVCTATNTWKRAAIATW